MPSSAGLLSLWTIVFATTAFAQTGQRQLRRSFYGMAYAPDGVILPECGANQTDITKDMKLMSQLTPRMRLYGADCNQTALVLQGIKDAGDVDLSVWLGIFVDGNNTVFQRQLDTIVEAIQKYGPDHIAGITVGNEYLLRSYGENGRPTDPAGVAARTTLLENIQTTNQTIQRLNLNKTIPIGTGDAGSAVTRELCEGTDFVMANVHPWHGGLPVEQAAQWTWQFFQDFDVKPCEGTGAKMYLAEAGWPTGSDNRTNSNNEGAFPSVPNLQRYLDDFVCQANDNGTEYFYFEFVDALWKKQYGGVEPHWGLLGPDRTLKAVTIPDCEVSSPTGGSGSSPSSSGTGPGMATRSGGATTSGGMTVDASRVTGAMVVVSVAAAIGLFSIV